MSQAVAIQSGPVAGSLGEVHDFAMVPMQSSGSSLAVGKIKIVADLYAAFADTSADTKRVSVVFGAAKLEGFDSEALADNLKAACKMADDADIREGFKPAEGATGQAKYGPRRSSMNARSSEIRQLFGALTNGASLSPEMGWAKAVKEARTYLKESGIQWDGAKALSGEEKNAKADLALSKSVRDEWMENHPQKAGESIRQYTERMLQACEILVVEAQQVENQKTLQKAADKLVEKHGIAFCGDLALLLAEMFNKSVEEQAPQEEPEILM